MGRALGRAAVAAAARWAQARGLAAADRHDGDRGRRCLAGAARVVGRLGVGRRARRAGGGPGHVDLQHVVVGPLAVVVGGRADGVGGGAAGRRHPPPGCPDDRARRGGRRRGGDHRLGRPARGARRRCAAGGRRGRRRLAAALGDGGRVPGRRGGHVGACGLGGIAGPLCRLPAPGLPGQADRARRARRRVRRGRRGMPPAVGEPGRQRPPGRRPRRPAPRGRARGRSRGARAVAGAARRRRCPRCRPVARPAAGGLGRVLADRSGRLRGGLLADDDGRAGRGGITALPLRSPAGRGGDARAARHPAARALGAGRGRKRAGAADRRVVRRQGAQGPADRARPLALGAVLADRGAWPRAST